MNTKFNNTKENEMIELKWKINEQKNEGTMAE